MKRRIYLVVAAVAALMALMAIPAQAVKHHSSTLAFEGADTSQSNPDSVAFVVGRVISGEKCRSNRTVKILFKYDLSNQFELVDTAKSGQSGTFAGEGFFEDGSGHEFNDVKFVLKPRKIGTKHHRQVCDGDALVLN